MRPWAELEELAVQGGASGDGVALPEEEILQGCAVLPGRQRRGDGDLPTGGGVLLDFEELTFKDENLFPSVVSRWLVRAPSAKFGGRGNMAYFDRGTIIPSWLL